MVLVESHVLHRTTCVCVQRGMLILVEEIVTYLAWYPQPSERFCEGMLQRIFNRFAGIQEK